MGDIPPFRPISLDFSSKGTPARFARAVERALREGVSAFQLRRNASGTVYPNALVPIAGLMDYYWTSAGARFISSRSLEADSYLRRVGLIVPYSNPESVQPLGFADKIWSFTADTHYDIVSGIVASLRTATPASKGILRSLELCLNEVTDNVLTHSREVTDAEPSGFVMAQVHKRNRRLAITVFDAGEGIPRTLASSHGSFREPSQAIAFALRKGVTSGAGRGNGLWIIDRIVANNGGSLEITSDGARYSLMYAPDGKARSIVSKATRLLPGTTTVDFQLNLANPVEIASVLGGYDPVDLWAEQREDELDERAIRLRVKDESRGCGTRVAAREMRTLVLNTLADAQGNVILDFDGIEVMSTSYADELVSKLSANERHADRLVYANLGGDVRRAIAEVIESPVHVRSS